MHSCWQAWTMCSFTSLDSELTDNLYILALSVVRQVVRPTYFAEFNLYSRLSNKHSTLWRRHGGSWSEHMKYYCFIHLLISYADSPAAVMTTQSSKAAVCRVLSLSVDLKHRQFGSRWTFCTPCSDSPSLLSPACYWAAGWILTTLLFVLTLILNGLRDFASGCVRLVQSQWDPVILMDSVT